MTFSNTRLGPGETPKALKYLIWASLGISLFAAVTNHLIPYYLGWNSLEQSLSLSSWGIDRLYIWQFLSYLFVQLTPHGISFSFLLALAFNAYVLWIIGASLIEKKGTRHFLALYFLGGIFSGLSVYTFQVLTQSPLPFAGNGAGLYTLLIAWLCLFPGAEFLLFMVTPIRASWIILGLLGINILIDLSTGNIVQVLAYLSASLFGYAYSQLFLKKRERSSPLYIHAKKFDFKTGKAILNDEEFMNEMLTKITLKGRSSLTLRERLRLRKISKKKKKK